MNYKKVHLYIEKEWSVDCDICCKIVAVNFELGSAMYVAMNHASEHKVGLSVCSCPECVKKLKIDVNPS